MMAESVHHGLERSQDLLSVRRSMHQSMAEITPRCRESDKRGVSISTRASVRLGQNGSATQASNRTLLPGSPGGQPRSPLAQPRSPIAPGRSARLSQPLHPRVASPTPFGASLNHASDTAGRMIARAAAPSAVATGIKQFPEATSKSHQKIPVEPSFVHALRMQQLAQQIAGLVPQAQSQLQELPQRVQSPVTDDVIRELPQRVQSPVTDDVLREFPQRVQSPVTDDVLRELPQRVQSPVTEHEETIQATSAECVRLSASDSLEKIQRLEEVGSGQKLGVVIATSEVSTAAPPTSAPGSVCGGASSCGAESSVTAMVPTIESTGHLHSASYPQINLVGAESPQENDMMRSAPLLASICKESNGTEMAEQLAQGLHLLNDALKDIHREKAQREALTGAVRNLSRRLDDGLVKVGEVTTAHSESESATDEVLSAMRRCIDELCAHCAWPPAGAQIDPSQGKSLSAAVHFQQKQIQELQQLQAQLEAQHEEQRQQVSSLSVIMQMQQQRMDEGVAAVTAAAAAFPSRLETMSESIAAVQRRVAELAVAAAEKAETDTAIAVQMSALQEKVAAQEQARLADRQQIEELFTLVRQQAPQKEAQVEKSALVETATGLQQLKDEVTTIATAVNILCGRMNEFAEEESSRSLQTEMGAIASVVSKLSERVDRLSGQEGCVFTPAADSMDTVELRQRLADLVGDVQRGHAELQGTEATAQALIPDSQLGFVINYLEKRAVESKSQLRRRPHLEIPTETRIIPSLSYAASAPQIVITKAPPPGKWLDEPLSVSVGRRRA